MAWTDATKTNAGAAMLGRMIPGSTPNWGTAVGGTGTVPPSALEEQTALANQKQIFQIVESVDVPNGKKLLIQVANVGLEESYTMQQLGIMAYLDDEPPILFAILQDNTGVAIPSAQEMPEFVINFYVIVNFSNKVDFKLNIDPSVFVAFGAMSAAITAAVSLKQDKITVAGILKGDGAGGITAALPGIDYGVAPIEMPEDPSTSTQGKIGQHYINTKTGGVYICVSTANGKYTWKSAGSASAEDVIYDGRALSDILDKIMKSLTNSALLKGAEDPTESTHGAVGQMYFNAETGVLFVCVAIDGDAHEWRSVGSSGSSGSNAAWLGAGFLGSTFL